MRAFPQLQISSSRVSTVNCSGWLPDGVTIISATVESESGGITLGSPTTSSDSINVLITATQEGIFVLIYKIVLSNSDIEYRSVRQTVIKNKSV